jgi:sulfotransferase
MNFIALSSLPRSGSTLLLYILNQNPNFKISPDSDLSYLLNENLTFIKRAVKGSQISHQELSETFINFCRSGANAWADTLRDEKILIDKSRGWTSDMDFTFKVFPNLKLIFNIRDLRAVVNSFEKVHGESIYADRKIYYKDIENDLQRQRLDGILNFPMLKDGLTALRELIEIPKKYNSNILITRHEDLIEDPDYFMRTIYDFLELPYYQHDFDNIEQGNNYNDNPYMPYGNHKIKSKLSRSMTRSYDAIRPDLLDQMTKGYSWYFKNFYDDRVVSK